MLYGAVNPGCDLVPAKWVEASAVSLSVVGDIQSALWACPLGLRRNGDVGYFRPFGWEAGGELFRDDVFCVVDPGRVDETSPKGEDILWGRVHDEGDLGRDVLDCRSALHTLGGLVPGMGLACGQG